MESGLSPGFSATEAKFKPAPQAEQFGECWIPLVVLNAPTSSRTQRDTADKADFQLASCTAAAAKARAVASPQKGKGRGCCRAQLSSQHRPSRGRCTQESNVLVPLGTGSTPGTPPHSGLCYLLLLPQKDFYFTCSRFWIRP